MQTPKNPSLCFLVEAAIGGVARHILDLVTSLKNDFSITVIYSNRRDLNFSYELKKLGSQIQILELSMEVRLAPFKDLKVLLFLRKHFQTAQYDLIHLHSSKAGFFGRVATIGIPHSKLIYTPHVFAFQRGYDLFPSFSNHIKKQFWVHVEKVLAIRRSFLICVCEQEKKEAIKYRLFSQKCLKKIPNGVTPLPFPPSKSTRPLQIGFIGRFETQKNISLLSRCIVTVCQKNDSIHFLLAGDGPDLTNLKKKIHSQKLETRVKFLKFQNQPKQFYQACHFIVVPSLWEGCPYVVLEALNYGVPVICSDISTLKELAESCDGMNFFNLHQKSSFASTVLDLFETTSNLPTPKIGPPHYLDEQIRQTKMVYENLLYTS